MMPRPSDKSDRTRGMHLLDIAAITEDLVDPPSATQWCVRTPDGMRHVYGDQDWVADERALSAHPGGWVECREIAIYYGDWERPDVAEDEGTTASVIAAARTIRALRRGAAGINPDEAYRALDAAVDALDGVA